MGAVCQSRERHSYVLVRKADAAGFPVKRKLEVFSCWIGNWWFLSTKKSFAWLVEAWKRLLSTLIVGCPAGGTLILSQPSGRYGLGGVIETETGLTVDRSADVEIETDISAADSLYHLPARKSRWLCLCLFSHAFAVIFSSGKSAAGFDLSGVIASEANFSKGDFKEVVMSKAYARVSLLEDQAALSKWPGVRFVQRFHGMYMPHEIIG